MRGLSRLRTDLSPTSQAGGGHPAPLEPGPWQRAEDQRGGPLAPSPASSQQLADPVLPHRGAGHTGRPGHPPPQPGGDWGGSCVTLLLCSGPEVLATLQAVGQGRSERKRAFRERLLYTRPRGHGHSAEGPGCSGRRPKESPEQPGGDAAPGTAPGPQFPLPNVRALASKLLQSPPL